jgi:hypothetical protein
MSAVSKAFNRRLEGFREEDAEPIFTGAEQKNGIGGSDRYRYRKKVPEAINIRFDQVLASARGATERPG